MINTLPTVHTVRQLSTRLKLYTMRLCGQLIPFDSLKAIHVCVRVCVRVCAKTSAKLSTLFLLKLYSNYQNYINYPQSQYQLHSWRVDSCLTV